MKQSYRTDLSDEQWELLEDSVSAAKPGDRPHRIDIREIINAIVLSCEWRNGLASITPRLSEMENRCKMSQKNRFGNYQALLANHT